MFQQKNKIFLLILISLMVHLAVLPIAYHGDMTNYNGWGKYILDHGPSTIYSFSFKGELLSDANYPPLMLWLCTLISQVVILLKNAVWQLNLLIPAFPSRLVFFFESQMPYIYIFKLILILSDLMIAWLIYLFLKKQHPPPDNLPLIGAGLILFNPAVIYGSTIWGQIDILPVVFILAGIYVLLFKKRVGVSSLFFAAAVLFKQTTIIFLPVYFLTVLKYFDVKKLSKALIIFVISLWIGYAPFVQNWNGIFSPLTVYLTKVQFAADNFFTTKSAWNFWFLLHDFRQVNDLSPVIFGVSYKSIGYGLVFLCLMMVFVKFWRNKLTKKTLDPKPVLHLLFLTAFFSFLFLTRLHERHLLQAVPLFIVLMEKNKQYFVQLIFISLFIVANLYYVWHPVSLILSAGVAAVLSIKFAIIILLILCLYNFRKFFFLK